MIASGLMSAFLVGLLGSLHCVGMCGGIVGALGCAPRAPGAGPRWVPLVAYNLGRIASYATAGAIAGAAGAGLSAGLEELTGFARLGRVATAVFMIALGLYLAGWTRVLAPLEQLGGRLWRRLEPLGRGLLPIRTPAHALGIGLLWGWLPCGMVYSVLVMALAGADAGRGALVMLAFGLGTLPMLLTLGGAAQHLQPHLRRAWPRRLAGAAIVVFGLFGLAGVLVPGAGIGNGHHPGASAHGFERPDPGVRLRARPADPVAGGAQRYSTATTEPDRHDDTQCRPGIPARAIAQRQDRAAGLENPAQPADRATVSSPSA